MITIRCTRKLRKYLAVGKVSGVSDTPSTVLGDWYANLLYTRRHRLIICVSDRTLLAVLVAAKNPAGFISRMQTSARSLLWALGVPSDAIEREMVEMDKVAIGAATNQSVLGSLRELALQARYALEHHPNMDLLTLAIRVAETPCGAIKYESPDRATLARLR